MSSPHDALFKSVFSDPVNARGALQAVLPGKLGRALDWDALALCPGSFVDDVLRSSHTDLLFATRWHDGSEVLVYLLFEHQSTQDRGIAFRLLRYQVRIWERWRSEHPGSETLPVVLPVVLYHGPTG